MNSTSTETQSEASDISEIIEQLVQETLDRVTDPSYVIVDDHTGQLLITQIIVLDTESENSQQDSVSDIVVVPETPESQQGHVDIETTSQVAFVIYFKKLAKSNFSTLSPYLHHNEHISSCCQSGKRIFDNLETY